LINGVFLSGQQIHEQRPDTRALKGPCDKIISPAVTPATAAMSEQHYAAGLGGDRERSFQFYPVYGDMDGLVEFILVNAKFIHRLLPQLQCVLLAFFGRFHFKGRNLAPDPGAAAFWALNVFFLPLIFRDGIDERESFPAFLTLKFISGHRALLSSLG